MPTNGSTIISNDAPSHKETGEDQLEDKEEEDDLNTTQPMCLLQWIMYQSPWTCQEAAPQIIGEDKADNKGTGGNEDPLKDTKDE